MKQRFASVVGSMSRSRRFAVRASPERLGSAEEVQIAEPFRQPVSWARSQRIRTAAELPFEIPLFQTAAGPVYRRIAARALQLRLLGLAPAVIARYLGVSDKTATKAFVSIKGSSRWVRTLGGLSASTQWFFIQCHAGQAPTSLKLLCAIIPRTPMPRRAEPGGVVRLDASCAGKSPIEPPVQRQPHSASSGAGSLG